MDNLEDIIVSSIEDAELGPYPTPDPVEATPTESVEASPEATETPTEPAQPAESTEVPSPAPKAAEDFDKKYGLTPNAASGRENRIPYSRVKKISEKAVNDAKSEWTKGLETSHVPTEKYQEVETRAKDYEARLTQVAEFERIMTEEPVRFLKTLIDKIPAYAQIFNQGQTQTPAEAQAPQAPVSDDMPLPDQELSDGSKVYSLEGLRTLNAWNREQARKETLAEVEKRFGPLEQDYQNYQRVQAVIPQVQAQIAEARQWPLFNESEEEVVKALQANPNWSLERAYQQVVWPKMQANRDQIRQDVLREVKQAPRSTSVQAGPTKAAPAPSTGPRSMEDVIAESIRTSGLSR